MQRVLVVPWSIAATYFGVILSSIAYCKPKEKNNEATGFYPTNKYFWNDLFYA
jgi:hypothetical protein